MSRKVVMASEDHFLDSGASASESREIWGTLPSCQIIEGLDGSAARNSYRMLLGYKEGNEQQSSPNSIDSGCWLNRVGDRNLLTWGNDLLDYSTSASTSPNIFKNEAYNHFSYGVYDNCQSDGSCDFFAAARSSDLNYKDEIRNYNLDRESQLSLNSWYDSCSRALSERSRPSASNYLRDCNEPNYLNDFEIKREPCPLLLGWDTSELDMHDSIHSSHMELEIHHPPSTSNEDHRGSPELEIYNSPPTSSKNHWDSLEKRTLLHLPPYTYQDHDFQGHHLLQKDILLRSPCVPLRLSYGPEQINPDDSGRFKNMSRGSHFFFLSQKGCQSTDSMVFERNRPALDAFLISQDFISDSGQEDSFPLQLHTIGWKETEV